MALVEAAIILTLIVLLTFGIIEYGMVFANSSTSASSSRAGARLASINYASAADKSDAVESYGEAVVADLDALSSATPVRMWLYRASSTGYPVGSTKFESCSTDCWQLTWNSSQAEWNDPTGGWANPDACGDTIDNVGVYVEVEHRYVTGLFGTTITIREHTVMRLEPRPLNQCP